VNWLIDTHILIWWAEGSPRLARESREILQSAESGLRLSVISLWEIALKSQAGKLGMTIAQAEAFVKEYGISLLPLLPQHMRDFTKIPLTHRDPFDRMLVAQADSTPLYLMTQDKSLAGLSPMVKVFS